MLFLWLRYVLQDDRLLATETVRETLMFAARMRLPASTTAAELERRVAIVLSVRSLCWCMCRGEEGAMHSLCDEVLAARHATPSMHDHARVMVWRAAHLLQCQALALHVPLSHPKPSCLQDLQLNHIAESFVGHPDDGGGISGGERKRLAVGM